MPISNGINIHIDEFHNQINQAIAQQNAAMAMEKTLYEKMMLNTKKDLSSSQTIYTLQIPADLLEESLGSIDRELAERASALSEIARLLEVVEETGSLIQHHISNLRMAAIQSERKKSKKPPQYSIGSAQGPFGGSGLQTAIVPPVEAAEWQFASAPLQQGQG